MLNELYCKDCKYWYGAAQAASPSATAALRAARGLSAPSSAVGEAAC